MRRITEQARTMAALLLMAGMMTVIPSVPTMAEEAWSLRDGQYVDASNNPIVGAVAKGITVTKYQNRAGGIDWQRVAADGVSFAMIRIGYLNDKDPYFDQNVMGAAASGIHAGAFFYTQALDPQTAVEEAEFVLEVVKEFPISYPIAYDVESQYLLDQGLTPQQITDNVNAFCRTIADAGYRPIVYGNNEWLTRYMDTAQIPYDIWYARYGTMNTYPNRTMWQCTDSGMVDGIEGKVTIEMDFAGYAGLISPDGWKHINGKWYYMKQFVKQTGWIQLGETWYYLDANGVMLSGTTMEIDGTVYTFDANGAAAEALGV